MIQVLADYFPNIQHLNIADAGGLIEHGQMHGQFYKELKKFTHLKELDVGGLPITKQDLINQKIYQQLVDFRSQDNLEELQKQVIPTVADLLKDKNIMQAELKEVRSELSEIKQILQNLVPVGAIYPYGGKLKSIPKGFLLCDGKILKKEEYPDLFAAIGTSFGNGTGKGTFNVPDFRGVFLRGQDLNSGRDPDANNRTSLNNSTAGDNVGSYQDCEIQTHNHTGKISSKVDNLAWVDGSSQKFLEGKGNPTGITFSKWSDVLYQDVDIDHRPGTETRPKNVYVNYIIKY